jgi:hypothetical protein
MEDKDLELLINDLCSRLPHSTKCHIVNDYVVDELENRLIYLEPYGMTLDTSVIDKLMDKLKHNQDDYLVKPYLRPMSSMTDEERYEYEGTRVSVFYENGEMERMDTIDTYDFLNKIHVDYRGFIKIGLAIEATENMYTKQ